MPSTTQAERAELLQLAQAQLNALGAGRGLFLKARQAIVRQRAHLYAHDELAMCTARLTLHGRGDYSPMREQLYLHKAEVRPRQAVPWQLPPPRPATPAMVPGVCELFLCRGSGALNGVCGDWTAGNFRL